MNWRNSQFLALYSRYTCICQSHILEVWNLYFYLVLITTKQLNSSWALHKNSRQITAPNLLWFILSILSQYELLPLEMTQMKISHVKYLLDVAASQQGWEELVVMFEVGLFKTLKSTVIFHSSQDIAVKNPTSRLSVAFSSFFTNQLMYLCHLTILTSWKWIT